MNYQGPHGFQSKEEWKRFFENYWNVISAVAQECITMPQKGISMEAWVQEYKGHSDKVRKIFTQVEPMLDWHLRYFAQDCARWDEKTADSLLSYLFRYCILMNDTECCFVVLDSLFAYYEKRHDEISQMKCCLIYISRYSNLNTVNWSDEVLYYCEKAAALYEKNFEKLDDEERSMGISIYDYWTDLLTELAYGMDMGQWELETEYMPVYIKSMEMIDYAVPTLDLNEPLNSSLPLIRMLYRSRMASLSFRCNAQNFTESQKKEMYEIAEELYQTEKADNPHDMGRIAINKITYLMTKRLMGRMSDEKVRDRILEMVRSFPEFGETDNIQSYSILLDANQAALVAMERLVKDNPSWKPALQEVLKMAIRRMILVPSRAYGEYIVCNGVYRYICPYLKYLDNRREIIQSLLGITVFRQVQTAFHTLVVGKLAVLIMENLTDRKPELLVGQLGTCNCLEVQEQKEKFINFAYLGALLHDVGKLFCSSVINTQYRKITDLEFETIRFHPGTGAKLLDMIPQIAKFRDIVIGHHKSFDGKTGYPADFDNTKSPVKIFIDLITICDSLDAATDTLGRNYTSAKTFSQVLQELQRGAGSQYSDVLVDFISSSEDLKKQLAELIETGRGSVYFDISQVIRKMI